VKPYTVLFADDDRDLQQVIGFILEAANYRVLFADNGLQALEMWQSNPIDILILDFVMPEINGLSVCKAIRRNSQVPILILTGNGQEEDIIRGLEAGADDYLVKPVRTRELVARVQALLRRSHGQTASSAVN
jgi:two-component system response regulator ResD